MVTKKGASQKFLTKGNKAAAPKPAGASKGAGKTIVRGFGLGKGKTGLKKGGLAAGFRNSVARK